MRIFKGQIYKVESFGFWVITPITEKANYSQFIGHRGQKFPITGNSVW